MFHVSLLRDRPWDSDSQQTPPLAPTTPTLIDGEVDFDVERIIDHRDRTISDKNRRTKREFLVKWRGYGHEYNFWQSEDDCKSCQDMIRDYYLSVTAIGRKRKRSRGS